MNQIPNLSMNKLLILVLLLVLVATRNYPMYKQCDSTWGSQQLGTSSKTICQAGCLISSVAMALSAIGQNYNPSSINKWLKGHGGYVSGDGFVWASVNQLGMEFEGKVANSQIKQKLDHGKVVMCNVHNGGHWVLAYGYNGDNIMVNDPYFSTSSYSLNEIVNGNNGIYKVGNGYLRKNPIGELMSLGHLFGKKNNEKISLMQYADSKSTEVLNEE